MFKGECEKDKFLFDHLRPDDFTKCYWQKTPRVLPIWIAYRLILFLYFFITFVQMVCCRPEEGFVWYRNIAYFAYWAYFMEVLVFALSFGITVARYAKEKKNKRLPPLEDMPWYYTTLWILYNIAAPSAIVVSVMFWLFTYNPDVNTSLIFSLITGLFNSLILLIDFCLWAIPYRFLHFYIPCLFAIVYCLFTIIYQFSGGKGNAGNPTLYAIVDWRKPGKTMLTLLIFLGSCFLFHCGFCTLQLIKQWVKKSRED